MGGSSSKVTQLNEVVTNITSKALIKVSTQCSGNISQVQHLNVGSNAVVKGLTLSQYATLDLSCLQNADISNQLQADLVATMMTEAQNSASQFPAQISNADSATEIENIMRTNLALELSQEALAGMQLGLTQEQKVNIGSGATVMDASLTQHAEAVAELVNSLSGAVTAALSQDADFKSTIEQTQTNFMTDMLDSVGNTMMGIASTVGDAFSSIFTFSDNTMIMVVVGLIVLGISGYFAASAASAAASG